MRHSALKIIPKLQIAIALVMQIIHLIKSMVFRDYRGGGRSSGRETIGRVAGGAVAMKLLEQLGISITAYASSIGPVTANTFCPEEI